MPLDGKALAWFVIQLLDSSKYQLVVSRLFAKCTASLKKSMIFSKDDARLVEFMYFVFYSHARGELQ